MPSKKINTFLDKFNEVVAQDMAEQRASAKRTLSRAPDYRVPPPAKEKKPEPEASGLAKGVPPATTNWHHLMKAYDAAQLVAPRDFFEVRKQVDAAGCKLGLPVVNVPASPMTASEADEARVIMVSQFKGLLHTQLHGTEFVANKVGVACHVGTWGLHVCVRACACVCV